MHLEELSENDEKSFLSMVGAEPSRPWLTLAGTGRAPATPAEFKKFAKASIKEKMDWRPSAKKTSVTRYLMRGEGDTILACGLMRFPLDEVLEADGGNLLVEVPLALQRRGYGSYCLALLLFEAVRAGLRRVLVTCVAEDVAARKMIEKNRGQLQDIVDIGGARQIARYWISFA